MLAMAMATRFPARSVLIGVFLATPLPLEVSGVPETKLCGHLQNKNELWENKMHNIVTVF
nr:hypothetical protein [Syntrophomonas zehnderi]